MARLLALVRHPTPVGHHGLCYGRRELALGPAADEELACIVATLRPLDIATVWSSPSLRAARPAEAIAAALACAPRSIDARLAELDFGAWEGQRWDAIERAAIDEWAADPHHFAPPGGESGADLIARVTDAFHDIMQASSCACIVTHGGPLKILTALAAGVPIDLLAAAPAFASVSIVRAGQ